MEASTSTPLPPGGLFEIVFSFDTTGSMSSVIDEVKGRLQDMIQRLQADIPGIRFGVLAHGDYCDKDIFYLEKHIDLTQDVKQLCDFVADVDGTGGGDPEECYELVLNLVRSFSWTAGSQRALVMIGDSEPHTPEYELNEGNLDWREEAKALASMVNLNIIIEPVHEIFNNVECATSKASDQPAHTRSPIRAFASRLSIL